MPSQCCLIKLLPCILFAKIYIYILEQEMASPRNQHCVNCIGTLSFHTGELLCRVVFPINVTLRYDFRGAYVPSHANTVVHSGQPEPSPSSQHNNLIGGLSTVAYVTTSVVSLLTMRQLGLLNNQQAIEISKER